MVNTRIQEAINVKALMKIPEENTRIEEAISVKAINFIAGLKERKEAFRVSIPFSLKAHKDYRKQCKTHA